MEQRALLASALVLGCVTAAGAGGFLAVRQMAPTAAEPVERVASGPEAITADPAEGTVADILPPNAHPRFRPPPGGSIVGRAGGTGRAKAGGGASDDACAGSRAGQTGDGRAAGRQRRRSAPDPPDAVD